MTQNHSLDWIERIEDSLYQLDEVPLMGNGPEFPWKELTQHLMNRWSFAGCTLKVKESKWRKNSELQDGLGENPTAVAVEFSMLNGFFYILMPKNDLNELTAQLLDMPATEILDPNFENGLLYYLVADMLQAITQFDGFKDLSPRLLEDSALTEEEAFCCDIEMTTAKKTVYCRSVMTKTLQKSWKEHFSQSPVKPPIDKLRKLDLYLHAEVARTILPLKDWHNAHIGDFLVLDNCSYDPDEKKGSAMLYLQTRPLFRARLRDNTLKIQDYPVDFEELTFMDDQTEEFDDDLDDDIDQDVDDDMDHDNDDEHEDDVHDVEDDDKNDDEEESDLSESPINHDSLSSVPVTISVQIAQIKINADQLLALRPGNVLELEQNASSMVNLMANGKKIGKGQLLRIGETLGVRITEL
ncbi:MAG: type III secretion system cytoplasmic ring protein SctQ [Parachlamydiales bacterium]|nr:type III secretion system cytoplasmic ring protein SctQ [Parachlamydiales bacterium]